MCFPVYYIMVLYSVFIMSVFNCIYCFVLLAAYSYLLEVVVGLYKFPMLSKLAQAMRVA